MLALVNQMLPPTINLEHHDPECKLDYVPNKAIAHSFDIGLSNSFGFGGHQRHADYAPLGGVTSAPGGQSISLHRIVKIRAAITLGAWV